MVADAELAELLRGASERVEQVRQNLNGQLEQLEQRTSGRELSAEEALARLCLANAVARLGGVRRELALP